MNAIILMGSMAFLAAVGGLALVIESGRRNRRATRAAERKRRAQQRKAELGEAGPED